MRSQPSSMPQLLSDRPPQLVRRPSLNDLVAALPTPLPCSRASFQRCLPCRTWKGFFQCSRLARICPSVPIAIPVPCASMACTSLQNTTPPRRCSPPKVWSSRCASSSASARAATPSTTSRTQPVACACGEASKCVLTRVCSSVL